MAVSPSKTASDADSGPIGPELINGDGAAPILLVCEHASNFVPPRYGNLGLSDEIWSSHAIWDPGAYEVACALSRQLDAPLIAGRVSRLVYDCNRPPEAPDAIPEKAEIYEIPVNGALDAAARQERIDSVYRPFEQSIADFIDGAPRIRALVTIHSFTPVFWGVARRVEIGLLHDADSRLADAMIEIAPAHTQLAVLRNDPYGPDDGVTHTLKAHGLANGLLNVMVEIRNDLIGRAQDQAKMSSMLADWIAAAIEQEAGAKENRE